MNFALTEEQRLLKEVSRKFCQTELAPLVSKAEALQEFPRDVYPKMAELGFLGISVPVEWGGSGLGKIEESIFIEEVAAVAGGFASSWMVQGCVLPSVIAAFGSDEQKRNYLMPMLRGEKIGSLAVTESEAGSDIRNISTTAKPDGNGFRIKGSKIFITQGTTCDFAVVLACTDKSKGIDGMNLFILDRSTSGFSSTKLRKTAYRSSETASLTFDDCFIPADAVMGGNNSQGFRGIMKTFVGERILVCARSVGIASSAFEAATRYAKERKQFGKTIGSFQAIAFSLAEMATQLEAARLFTQYAAWLWDTDQPHVQQVAMAKLFSTEAAAEITEKALRIFGGYGLIEDAFPAQRAFMDARVSLVTVGSSEIQKRAIAKQLGLACD